MKKSIILVSSLSLSLLVAALVGCDVKNLASTSDPSSSPTAKTEAEYIAQGKKLAEQGHCLACHTPLTPTGPDMTKAFAGGNGWLIPGLGIGVSANITSGGKLKDKSVEDMVAIWSEMSDPIPPMPNLGKTYDAEELKALATYLKSLPANDFQPPASYRFAGKAAGDKSWPAPAFVQDEHTGGEIFNLEVIVAGFPGGNQGMGQALIDANIGVANASAQ